MLWEIETDKEDRAKKLKPISSVIEFVARLKKSLVNSVQPFVDDVKILDIRQSDDSSDGYVKVRGHIVRVVQVAMTPIHENGTLTSWLD